MAEQTQLLVVPHTHWDREWYQTFQQFRMRLVRAVDTLLAVLESDPTFRFFTLDGQMIVLEDYLAIRPENAERLRRLAREGRLLVGPWYLQPDEFLVGGESLIRNLQIGMRLAEPYGGAMPVGYVPDTFGHIAQLPQILRGFGLDNAVFWRGVGPEVACSEFHWAAPDGSEVLVIWLAHETGYSNAAVLPLDPEQMAARIGLITSVLKPRATTNVLLLMNGSDHLEPQTGLPAALEAANERLRAQGMQLFLGTLPQYIAVVREGHEPLHTYHGEMRSSYHAHLLPGVYSTRMWLKQRNAACEALLTRWAEPATAWAWALGEAHPTTLLNLSWNFLLKNHPHDSICGCGIDQVHREMLPRFAQSEQIAEEMTTHALAAIARQVETRGPEHAVPVVVFNPASGPRTDLVRCEAQLRVPEIEVVDSAGRVLPHQVLAAHSTELLRQEVDKALVVSMLGMATDGQVLNYVITDVRVSEAPEPGVGLIEVTVSEHATPEPAIIARAKAEVEAMAAREEITTFRAIGREAPRSELLLLARDVPAFGGQTLFLRPKRAEGVEAATSQPWAVRAGPNHIENEYLAVTVEAEQGTLTLRDKLRGVEYVGLNQLVDGGDVGDLYTYCPPASDWRITAPCRLPLVELTERGPMRATLKITRVYRLPAASAAERDARGGETVECTAVSEVSLAAAARRVEIRTTVANAARDHRLRVHFPVPFAVEEAEAEGSFEVARRPAQHPLPPSGTWADWAEVPVNTHPQKRFVSVGEPGHGLAVLNRGLAEYEALPSTGAGQGGAIALTLLRCVEWLSRGDLATRKGHAGPALHTPEAQGLGTHPFEYALVPHAGTWHADDALVLREAQAYEAGLRACIAEEHSGTLPPAWSFVRVSPGSVVLSAVKRAESGAGVVVRIYNPLAEAVAAELTLALPCRAVRAINLNEEALASSEAVLPLSDGRVRLTLRGGEIRSLLCELA
ncbi:MAG TPA: glycoside hydrolase family 38 C-terminal domain-containing protein [Ktedonobacterales bacterium]